MDKNHTISNCSHAETPNITTMFTEMSEVQKIFVYLEIFVCVWLMGLLAFDSFYLKKYLTQSPRLQSVLFIQSTFVFYATTSLLAVISPRSSTLTELVFTVYMSFTLKELLWLMIDYLGGDKYAVANLNGVRLSLAVTPCACMCCCCCPTVYLNRKYMFWVKFGVYQSAFIHTIFDFISAFLWTNGSYKDGMMEPMQISFYLVILEKISILTAMYALTSIYVTARQILEPYHVTGKFMSVQTLMILSGFQETVFNFFEKFGLIKCKGILSGPDRAIVFHHYIVVPEMLLLYFISRYFHTREEGGQESNFSRRSTVVENPTVQRDNEPLLANGGPDTEYNSIPGN